MFSCTRVVFRTILPKTRIGFAHPGAVRRTNNNQGLFRSFTKNLSPLQIQTEHKAQLAGNLNKGLSEEQKYFDFKRDSFSPSPKVWGGGIDAVTTAVTGVVVGMTLTLLILARAY